MTMTATTTPTSLPIADDAAVRNDAVLIKTKDRTNAQRQARYRQRKRALVPAQRNAVTKPRVTPAVTEAAINAHVTVLPPERPRDPIVFGIGRGLIGLTLIGSALFVAYTSMRANAWLGIKCPLTTTPGKSSQA